jgi:flagellar biosynthetic protein FlhB
MADSAQDRNLPATAKRRQRAREDGQVPRSKDLGHFTALAAGGALLMVLAHPLASWAQGVLDAGLRFDRERAVNPRPWASCSGCWPSRR